MSRAKHTPGPWTAGTENVNAPDGSLIAEVMGRHRDRKLDNGEWKANAALIAAAPEMLEALKECREYLDNFCREDSGEMSCMAPWDQLCAAIEKAMGKAK